MRVLLSYNPKIAQYRFSESHPLRPERFSLAVELMAHWGLLDVPGSKDERQGAAQIVEPPAANEEDILLVHTPEYVSFVQAASREPRRLAGHGIGPGDTPAFAGMHDAAALAVGATSFAVDAVLGHRAHCAFSPAGGLHHAHRDHASGFCIYNDCAIAIERATRSHPGLRVAYVDVDAHHGDGVEAAFYRRPDVLTLSVHESGRYLFPGTGQATDIGEGAGRGAAINVPLPPDAGPECFDLVVAEVIEPALAAFAPDLILVQAGGDSHRGDPLTHLYQSVEGYCRVLQALLASAETLTEGRIVATGGGGYQPFSAVPRMWASAMALLLGADVPRDLPAEWIDASREAAIAAHERPSEVTHTFEEEMPELDNERNDVALQATEHAVRLVQESAPLLGAHR